METDLVPAYATELPSILVYGWTKSRGVPVEFTFIDTVDELNVVNHISELVDAE